MSRPFICDAGRNVAYCPGCGRIKKIIKRSDVTVATDRGDYETEGITTECQHCGNHQIMRLADGPAPKARPKKQKAQSEDRAL